MAVTVPEFRTRFPEFADETDYPEPRIQLFIDDTLCFMGTDEDYWCCYDKAQAYLAAHLLLVGTGTEAGNTGTTGGPVQSKTAGGVSVTRAIATKDRSEQDLWLSGTSYGQQFIALRNQCFVGVVTANSFR